MTRDVVIEDIRGRRVCTDADFPLRIGVGPEADIRLPDMQATGTLALIARSESHLFVQPVDDGPTVRVNDEVLNESRWLEHGDALRVAGTTVRYEAGVTSVTFLVDVEAVTPPVQAPKQPPPAQAPISDGARRAAPRPGSRRRRIVTGIALTLFLALTVAAGFVFMATAVSVQVSPAPDHVSIDGLLPGFEVGGRLLLIPGDYRIRANKTGYRSLDRRVTIEDSGEQTLAFTLEKLPGLVTFVVRPAVGAEVRMDGESLGRTPIQDMEVPPGRHAFTVEADRYAPAAFEVSVRGLGERQSIDVALSPLWADISISSLPAGARIMLDGEDVGETPLAVEILEGTHELALVKPGFDTFSTALRVVANQPQKLGPFTLVESDGLLAIDSKPSAATVMVAGEFRGRTPLELSLAPRKPHTISISKAGYESIERKVTVDPASSEKLTLTLAPRYGTLLISSLPVDAELYVDGRLHGPATGRIRLTTRAHERCRSRC